MSIDNTLVIMGGVTYSILFILSVVMIFLPATKNRSFYAYRSALANETEKNWNFAQHYVPRLMLQVSFIFLCLCFLAIWFTLENWMNVLIIVGTLGIFGALIYYKTEAAIKDNNIDR